MAERSDSSETESGDESTSVASVSLLAIAGNFLTLDPGRNDRGRRRLWENTKGKKE